MNSSKTSYWALVLGYNIICMYTRGYGRNILYVIYPTILAWILFLLNAKPYHTSYGYCMNNKYIYGLMAVDLQIFIDTFLY